MRLEQAMQQGPMGPMHDGSQSLTLFIIFLLLLAVIFFLFYRWPKYSSVEKLGAIEERMIEPEEAGLEARLEVALRLLDENERKVVEAIITEGGSMLQKDISYQLGFSRVKTHRVVQTLVKRGLVTTEKHYNTNMITLVDWLR